jgi:hypothetical protein
MSDLYPAGFHTFERRGPPAGRRTGFGIVPPGLLIRAMRSAQVCWSVSSAPAHQPFHY